MKVKKNKFRDNKKVTENKTIKLKKDKKDK